MTYDDWKCSDDGERIDEPPPDESPPERVRPSDTLPPDLDEIVRAVRLAEPPTDQHGNWAMSHIDGLVDRVRSAQAAIGRLHLVVLALAGGPCPADDRPPHPLTYSADDTDLGRTCMTCGFPVPGGYRHIHSVWCAQRYPNPNGPELAEASPDAPKWPPLSEGELAALERRASIDIKRLIATVRDLDAKLAARDARYIRLAQLALTALGDADAE